MTFVLKNPARFKMLPLIFEFYGQPTVLTVNATTTRPQRIRRSPGSRRSRMNCSMRG